MFAQLLLNPENINVLVRQVDSRMNVVIVVGFVIFVLYTIVKVFYPGYYHRLFYVLFKQDYSGSSFAESNTSFINAGYYVLFASVLSISATAFVILAYNNSFSIYFKGQNVLVNGAIILAIIILILFSKWLIYSFFGWLFESSQHSRYYLNMFFYNLRVLGILFFPIFLIYPFVDENTRNILLFSVIGWASISTIYTFYTFWKYSIRIKFFNHYAILYFCAFEILPILLVWKMFKG